MSNADAARELIERDPTGGHGVNVKLFRDLLNGIGGSGRMHELSNRAHKMAYSIADIHVDSFLTNFSVSYRSEVPLIADEVLPVVKVEKASDVYPIWARADANKVVNAYIGPRDFPGETYQSLSSGSYIVVPRGLWSPVPNDLIIASDMPLDLLGTASQDVREALMKSRELRVATLVMTASGFTYTTALSGTTRWDVGPSTSTADPVSDIMTYMDLAATRPNMLVMSRPVWTALRKHPRVLAALKGTAGAASTLTGIVDGVATNKGICELFEVDRVLVGDAKYRTSADGAAETYGYMWGTGCVGIYQEPAKVNSKAWGKTFRHQEMNFTTYFDQRPGMTGVTYVKGAHSDIEKVTAAAQGFCLDTVIS